MSAEWLGRQCERAPATLAARVADLALGTPPGDSVPDTLAAAGAKALERVALTAGDRSVALDLLAADALITLALLAQAQEAPAQLGTFARSLLPGSPAPR